MREGLRRVGDIHMVGRLGAIMMDFFTRIARAVADTFAFGVCSRRRPDCT